MLGCAAVGLGGVGGSEVSLDIAAGDVGMGVIDVGLTWGMAMVVSMGQDLWEWMCSLHPVGCGLLTW